MDATAQRERIEEALRRSLMLSLRNEGDDWYRPTLTRARALVSTSYREVFGARPDKTTRDAISARLEEALKAVKRDPDQRATQASKLARSLAVFITSAVVDANTPGDQWEKVWRTMHDDKVRDSHVAADGQVVDGDGFFTVGGVKMFAPGDPNAPGEEWLGCRCHAEYRRRTAMPEPIAAAASPEDEQGAFVIVGLPAEDDPIWEASSEQPPHITLLYLSSDFLEQADQIVAGEAPKWEPYPVVAGDVTELGDGGATVVLVGAGDLASIREQLLTYEPIQQGFDAVEQFPEWTPHLTLGYPETPPPGGKVPANIEIDRIAILASEGEVHSTYTLGEPMSETAVEPEVDDVEDDDAEEFPTSGVYEEVPLYGVLAPEGRATGDKRGMRADSLEWTDPPLTLRWMIADDEMHKGSVASGRIDRIWREDGLIKFEGVASMSEDGDRMVGLIGEKVLRGISVDLDDMVAERGFPDGSALPEADEQGNVHVTEEEFDSITTWITKGRIRSAAALPIPAFPEAFIAIGTWAEHDAEQAGADQLADEDAVDDAMVASVIAEAESVLLASGGTALAFGITSKPGTEDGPGWLTHPIDTDRLRDYWVRGKGAAKIGWGMSGDFNRCRAFLAEYIKPIYLAGYCANRHKDALGFWPGEHRGGKHSSEVEPFNLVASVSTLYRPPMSVFEDPHFVSRAPMTITDPDPKDGLRRVYGHAAEWDTCHTGFADRCVSPPSSPSNYAHYHLGYVVLDDGTELPTGTLTMNTGHAELSLSAAQAAAHYDNTGTAFAQVRMGEDAIGIWFAGVIQPNITDEEVFALRGAKISGDWRGFAGQLDAIAMLAVNTPGFPIVRTALAASAGHRNALVAAGIVEVEPPNPEAFKNLIDTAVSERLAVLQARDSLRLAARARQRDKMASLAASVAARRQGV